MASSKSSCDRYKYIMTASGPKVVPIYDTESKEEESAADYNPGGYLPIQPNDTFKDGRYLVLRKLGWGHFSTVWLVKDNKKNSHSALKVVKSATRYTETARDEIKLLTQISEGDPTHRGRDHVCQFFDAFDHQGLGEEIHVCIITEPLGESLLALLERNRKSSLPINLVRIIAHQILLGLEYLHDECDLIHTDIKPENILVSIPQVEQHIGSQLSISPPPSSRMVGIPPVKTKSGQPIPQSRRQTRGRQIQIFDSQPLASPPPSRTNSFSTSLNNIAPVNATSSLHFQMVKIASASAAERRSHFHLDPSSSSSSPISNLSSSPESNMSASIHMGKSYISTPPTPLDLNDMSIRVMSMSMDEQALTASLSDALSSNFTDIAASPGSSVATDKAVWNSDRPSSQVRISPPSSSSSLDHHVSNKQSLVASSRPSLLSQTAPKRMPTSYSSTLAATSHTPMLSSTPTPVPTRRNTPPPPPMSIKIADMGNATPATKHYTEDIQTRQYRAPEAIIGRKDWDARVDVWSTACVIFELLTSEFLFDPLEQPTVFVKDDDHMAQIIELMGDYPIEAKLNGRFSADLFRGDGQLKNIRSLKFWPLKNVLKEKYRFSDKNASELCGFLEPMLVCDFKGRAQARDMLDHPWLTLPEDEQWNQLEDYW